MLSARLNTPDEAWRPASGAGGFRGARGKSLLFFLSVWLNRMGSEPSDHRFGVLIRREHWVEDVLNPTITQDHG